VGMLEDRESGSHRASRCQPDGPPNRASTGRQEAVPGKAKKRSSVTFSGCGRRELPGQGASLCSGQARRWVNPGAGRGRNAGISGYVPHTYGVQY